MKQTKANLIANITQDISDNATQEITPKDVRQNLLDIVDSVGNLLFTEEIVSTNFSTPATRTTIAGEEVLSKLGQESYVSVDNSAFGYAALKQNFAGERNTALGAYALSCNVYGTDNVGVGYSSLAGNSNGVANVGIGEYTLYYNKLGNMNVAIGHGAGYYADREDSSKLYIAVHPVTEQYVCDNPEGVGLTPLVYGDFELGKFGINVNDFHPYGAVQVSGAISPSLDESFDLGHEDYSFNTAHARAISFSAGISNTYDPITNSVLVSGVQTHSGDIKPSTSNVYSIGSPSEVWRNAHTENLYVYGTATINELNTITSCLYECKTLYLATSGICDGEVDPCGYLPAEELDGAGLVIPSSGVDGLVNYNWTVHTAGRDLGNLPNSTTQGQANRTLEQTACFGTTTNIELSGVQTHIIAPQHLGRGTTIFGNLSELGVGLVSKGMCATEGTYDPIVFSNFDYMDEFNNFSRHSISSIKPQSRFVFNITGVSNSDVLDEINSRRVAIETVDVEVPASLQFQHSAGRPIGTEFYSTASGSAPGLYIHTYDGSNNSEDQNTVSIMQSDSTGGVLGVNDFEGMGKTKLPETIINARSKSDASIRVTAENAGNVSAALELCGELNCLQDAGELVYNKTSGVMVMSTYADSGRVDHITLKHTSGGSSFGIYNDAPAINSMVNIGNANRNTGLAFSNFPSGYIPSSTNGFTTLISRDVDSNTQSSELIYIDTSGNVFPLSLVNDDVNAVYGDSTNIFAGSGCPADRSDIIPSSGNTAYGVQALHNTDGTAPVNALNTAVGYKAGYGLAHSTGNVILGSNSIVSEVSGINTNIIIGNNIEASGNNNVILGNTTTITKSNNSIVIGNDILLNTLPDNSLIIGSSGNILLSGVLNQSNALSMPRDGSFSLHSFDNLNYTTIKDHSIKIVGDGDRYGENPFVINFTGQDGAYSNDLVTLDHSSFYTMNNTEAYETTNPRRPFMHIDGDLRIRGALRLADGTSLESASAVNDIESLIQALQDQIDVQTIEGTMLQDVDSPISRLAPTQGLMTRLDGTTETILNRDIYLRLEEGDYVIANRVMGPANNYEYRPVWVSNENSTCGCSRPTTT
jgi:hypothetical protein